jgi:hypothetical protein
MNTPDISSAQNSSSTSTSSPPSGKDSGPSSVRDTVQKVREATATTAGKAKAKVAEIAGEGKSAAANRVAGYSDRLREAARSAEAAEDPNVAHFAAQAADRLEKVADYVRDADFARMREDATQTARRHPALFLGGMFVAGIVLGNLAKASLQSLSESGADADGGPSDENGEPRSPDDDVTFSPQGSDDDILTAGANYENRNSEP